MAVGDCQYAFGEAARRDGVVLVAASIEGLTDAGHLGLPPEARNARRLLERIFLALGGDLDDLARGAHRSLRPDWFHDASDTAVEVDEEQHFTSDRLRTLSLYDADQPLGFDLSTYKALCEQHRASSDRYRAAKPARGFRREGGRRAQRAYFDAVRDIGLPALGFSPVIRVPAFGGDGRGAYLAARANLRERLGLT